MRRRRPSPWSRERTRHADGVVAVGSGVLIDSCKHATFQDGRRYAMFGTAASMNGYAASTASVTLANGYKTSLPSHAPRGIFLDLEVSAEAPTWLSAAGLGDSLCRLDGADRLVGLAPSVRHLLFDHALRPAGRRRGADDRSAPAASAAMT